jgi:DNA-directed RNA polymerase specialized sigma24 family protein
LYQRALGYDHNGKHYPADVTACIFYLKNRAPEEWRDRQEQRHTVVQDNRSAAEILAELKRDMAEMGLDLVPRDDGIEERREAMLELINVEGCTQQEAADILGVSQRTVSGDLKEILRGKKRRPAISER